jgi:probable addiction module antidote protein
MGRASTNRPTGRAQSRSHEEATIESFRKDPAFAAELLSDILADGDQDELMVMLKYLAKAFGGVGKLAGKAEVNVTSLYRTLSKGGNPELKTLRALLKAMGFRLAVAPLAAPTKPRRRGAGARRLAA